MAEVTHTPAPWRFDVDSGNSISVYDADGLEVCTLINGDDDDVTPEMEANARLISAAPEMLPIVELIAGIELPPAAEGWPDDRPLIGYRETVITVGHVRAARAAIAKATGGRVMSDLWMGWHFSDESECLRYGDGRKIAVGVTHTVDCTPVLCESGLHASQYVRDALQYAPGPILWRVSLAGRVVHGDDKSCATARTYHARIDATDVLRAFARKCALDVIHLWDAPSVVREYLETGNEELRAAAWVAARDAARVAQRDTLEKMVTDAMGLAS